MYLRTLGGQGPWWRALALVMYSLAMLTKVEAISFAAVLFLAEILLNPGQRDQPLWRRVFAGAMWLRLAPFLAMTVFYLAVWKAQSPIQDAANRAALDMTSGVYFMTQWSAWWHYVGHVFAPVDLVADELAFPIAKTPWEFRTLLALEGWIVVGVVLLACARRAPAVTFLGGAFLLYLAPTSSVMPLAEMVNEHRPYLPVTGVVLLLCAGLFALVNRLSTRPALVGCAATALVMILLTLMTRDRNRDWRDELTLWQDTAEKSPESSRAQMNYGLALMRLGRYEEAVQRFRRTIELAPFYHYAYSNLAIALDAMGDKDTAAATHDLAVQYGAASDVSYYWRGRFRAKHGDYDGAIADFTAAAERSGGPLRELAALVETMIRAGREAECGGLVAQGLQLAGADFDVERAAFRSQVLGDETAQRQMGYGLEVMRRGEWIVAEKCFREALRLDPAYHYAATNLGICLAGQGRIAEAVAAHDQAVTIAPNQPSPYAWRGKFREAQGQLPQAIEDYRKAADLNPGSIDDLLSLAQALVRAGRNDEALSVVTQGERLDRAAFSELRARLSSQPGQ
jgi:tetratricopeptide (TPR) repeat protein